MEIIKVRCIKDDDSNCFTKGNIYEIKGGFIIDDDGDCHNHKTNTVDELNRIYNAQFELYEDTPSKPNLCEILRVEVDEIFYIKLHGLTPYHVSSDGMLYERGIFPADNNLVCSMINRPELIVRNFRNSQFTNDENGLIRLCVNIGYLYAARDKNNDMNLYKVCPIKGTGEWLFGNSTDYYKLPDAFLSQIKWSDPEPFNMAEYLKGLS